MKTESEKKQARRPDPNREPACAATKKTRGSRVWVPYASYLTTGQFAKLGGGFVLHCGPTAAANLIRTIRRRMRAQGPASGKTAADAKAKGWAFTEKANVDENAESLFLLCADVGKRMGIYWNKNIFGRLGGTSNLLAGIFLRRCLNKAGLHGKVKVRFHPWITPDALAESLDQEAIVYLEVMFHPKYKNHHMLCYSYREKATGDVGSSGELVNSRKKDKASPDKAAGRLFLLADGWASGPVWIDEKDLGHGHFFAVGLI